MLIVETKEGAAERPAAASELPPRPEAANRKPETAERAERAQPTKTYQRYMIDQLERMISD